MADREALTVHDGAEQQSFSSKSSCSKCCTDSDGNAVICSSTTKLLQLVDIQHPAGFVINDACQGQYKKYGTNCKTLVCMAGFWSKAAQDLQDQGVPCPIIIQLFDEALDACEDVCQELSFPLMEALREPHNAQETAENLDTVSVSENATGSAMVDRDLVSESGKICYVCEGDGHADRNSDGEDDNISWYFDGHIPGPDGHIPGIDELAQGLTVHIPGVINHIPGIDNLAQGVNDHIPQVINHLPGANGIVDMENVDDSHSVSKTLLHSTIPNPNQAGKNDDLSPDFSSDDLVVSSEKIQGRILPEVEYIRPMDCLRDRSRHVTRMTLTSVNSDSLDKVQKITDEDVFLGERENGERLSNSRKTFYGKPLTRTSQHVGYISTALSSKSANIDDEEDEFEASFVEAVSNSSKSTLHSYSQGLLFNNTSGSELKNLGNKVTKLSVEEKSKDNSSIVGESKSIEAATQEKETGANVQSKSKSSRSVNTKLLDSQQLPSSGRTDKEITDRLLFLVTQKLESKGKAARTQFKLSEIYKGSRHFISSSEESVLAASSSRITRLNQITDIFPHGDFSARNSTDKQGRTGVQNLVQSTPLRPNLSEETSDNVLNGKTTVQSTTRTVLAGKVDSQHSTSAKKILEKNTIQSEPTSNSEQKQKCLGSNEELLTRLGDRMAHGKQLEMKLAVEIVTSLFNSSGKASLEEFEIHLNMIHTELIFGPPSSFSQTVDGLLLENPANFQFSTIVSGSQRFIALVNGDVTADFRHTGLNNEVQIHRIIEHKEFKDAFSTQEEYWYQCNTSSLRDHKIGVLVSKGIVQDSILDYCLSHNIVVLQNVAYPTLQLLSFATGSVMVTYLADLKEKDLGRPVTIDSWELGWTPLEVIQSKVESGNLCNVRKIQLVLIKEFKIGSGTFKDINSPLQTVLLCSPCKDHVCDAEHRFWNSIHRLKNALACDRVLPGAGAPEIACIRRLNELTGQQNKAQKSRSSLPGWLDGSLEVFRPLVYSAFSEGFKDYLGSVVHNSGTLTIPSGVSSYIEELITAGFFLDFLLNAEEEKSVNTLNDIEAKNTRGHPRANVKDFTTASCSTTRAKAGVGAPLHSGKLSHKVEMPLVWDDYSAKKEAWKRALGVVGILLQSDKFIKTGLESNSREADIF